MSNSIFEVLGARDRRRRWSLEEKLRIVAESQEAGAVVRAVAARHDVYPSLLHNWRRQMRDGRLAALPAADFLPVHVAQATTVPAQRSASIQRSAETIEIELPDGCACGLAMR